MPHPLPGPLPNVLPVGEPQVLTPPRYVFEVNGSDVNIMC